jgi:hypothetical protein
VAHHGTEEDIAFDGGTGTEEDIAFEGGVSEEQPPTPKIMEGEEEQEEQEQEEVSFTSDQLISLHKIVAIIATDASASKYCSVNNDLVEKLGVIPDIILDKFSSVLGDMFHYMHRTVVPVHHTSKKGYFVALRDAFFAFDPVILEEVKLVLRVRHKMSEEEIKNKMYYDFRWFARRVPRVVLPPSKLYYRVRAVYSFYGYQRDGKTNSPLFNALCWEKAKGVLSDILLGYASDPPYAQFYYQSRDARGALATDSDGLVLYDCCRGTNDTECFHKQLLASIGTWACGVEMTDCVLAECRHRYNLHVSERRHPGFVRTGHYDTWMIDILQILV